MNSWTRLIIALGVTFLGLARVSAQTSSLGARKRLAESKSLPRVRLREAPKVARHVVYDRYSWVAVAPKKPKMFKVGDLITVIVRERREYDADSQLDTNKRLRIQSELGAFVKLVNGGLGASNFSRGKPTIDYNYVNRLTSDGDIERNDSLTLRLTATILDVKPNGVLVLEAKTRIRHDDEVSEIELAGSCRKEDVTADNTVLSTQLAHKSITVSNHGALRAASSHGWILKLLDLFSPF